MKKFLFIGLIFSMLTGCDFALDFNGGMLNSSVNEHKPQTSMSVIEGSAEEEGLKGIDYLKYYSDLTNCKVLPSLGEQNILVVPVLFKDDNINDLPYQSSKIFDDLDKTFNGSELDTGWESVNSYYQKSSYGKLDIKSTIVKEWIRLDKTFNEIARLSSDTYYDPTWYVVDNVVNELASNPTYNLKDYDNDQDGYVDGIWLIYGRNSYSNIEDRNPTKAEEEILWAYTFWEYNNSSSVDNPKANVYCWGSYDFMYGSKNTPMTLDAHTFIHETGHMLGLDDYYDYDDTANPSGCLDMMDYNIGDHNAYTKYLLGWVEPKVYDYVPSNFTLKPFEESGECILIPASNERSVSVMEEYLLIEYYTPTGLNEYDSKYKYLNYYPKMFTKNGIKIYHIDSRIGALFNTGSDWVAKSYAYNFTKDDLYSNTTKFAYFSIMASNTPSYSYVNNFKLLSLISNYYGPEYMYRDNYAQNRDLFTDGSKLESFKFNSSQRVDLNIKVTSINDIHAKISIG